MALFDKIKVRLQKEEMMETEDKGEVKEKVPRWSEELQEEISSKI